MIQSLGFSMNMTKTVFEPTASIELPGFIIDTVYGLPERRLRKLESTAGDLLSALETDHWRRSHAGA